MSFTERDEAIAFWLAQMGHAIACEDGPEYLPDVEIFERSIVVRCRNCCIAGEVWEFRDTVLSFGCDFTVRYGKVEFGSTRGRY